MTNLTQNRHPVPGSEHAGGPTTPPEPIDHQDETAERAATEAFENAGSGSTTPTPEGDPTCLGRYRVIRRLGQGGFGRVHLAQDDELDRPVAIKVPHPERILGPEDMEQFVAAPRALARLDQQKIDQV